jgi:hypothetical protein
MGRAGKQPELSLMAKTRSLLTILWRRPGPKAAARQAPSAPGSAKLPPIATIVATAGRETAH